jgi:dipeptidyl aminopeptidase/acylaminoacyl peptidase
MCIQGVIALTLLVVAAVVIVAERGCTNWIAHGVVDAPNAGKAINPADDQSPSTLKSLGISEHMRIDVGPPEASLSVWIINPPPSMPAPKATILVLHGIRDRKDSQIDLGHDLAAAGYRAVLTDLRGHGRSSGQWLTYGVIEAKDLHQVLDALTTRQLIAGNVGVLGTSYGGSVGIQLAGMDPRVKAVVAIAPFANVRELLGCYAEQIGINWAISTAQMDAGFAKAGELAQCDLTKADPVTAIRTTSAHVLLIHGRDDAHIPFEHSQQLANAAGDRARLVIVDQEDHNTIGADRTNVIHREMLAWFDDWLNPH